MGVADLDEQGFPQSGHAVFVRPWHRQIDGGEYAARQREQGAGPTVDQAFQSIAARLQRAIIRHVHLLVGVQERRLRIDGFYSLRSRTKPKSSSQPISETAQYSRSPAFQQARCYPLRVTTTANASPCPPQL